MASFVVAGFRANPKDLLSGLDDIIGGGRELSYCASHTTATPYADVR